MLFRNLRNLFFDNPLNCDIRCCSYKYYVYMFNFTVCQLEISAFFCAALSDGSLPWSGDGACATCSASSGRTATPYSPISTMSWLGVCAEGNDDDPLLSSSLQMIWRQTACSTIAWLAGLECTGSASAVSSDAHRSAA